MTALPVLEDLRLNGGALITDESLECLRAMPALRRVDFSSCSFELASAIPGLPRAFSWANHPNMATALEAHLGIERVLPRPKAL